jgi:tetratricopeptide (TPR) repeat protein
LLGFIVGFMFANTVNMRGVQTARMDSRSSSAAIDQSSNPQSTHAPGEQSMEDVRASIEKAKNEPNNFEAQVKAAELFAQINRFDQAIKFLEQANQIKPDSYETVVQLGNMNHAARNFQEAERWYTIALAKKPEDIDVRTDLGLTFFLRNPPDLDRAIKEYRRSLEKNPKHEATLNNLAIALLKKGNTTEAQTVLTQLEKVNPKNEAIPKIRDDLNKLRSGTKTQASLGGTENNRQ